MRDITTKKHAVVIVGGGPTGLMLAGELALAGIDAAVIERRASQELVEGRAGGLHSRTIEIFDQRGIADRFLSKGQPAQIGMFAGTCLDIGDFPTRHNYGLGLWQNQIEGILAGWCSELDVNIYRGNEVKGIAQDDVGVAVETVEGQSLRAEYLVGCDGGHSCVRKSAGIEFPGWDPTTSSLIAEAEMTEEPPFGVHRTSFGVHAFGKEKYEIRDGKIHYLSGDLIRVMVTEPHVTENEPTLGDVKDALLVSCGTDYGIHSPRWISRFTDRARQASAYRKGRVLLAGDAAHVHPPDGGQGLQIGVQDAVNLGWKLAQVLKGTSPAQLLDSYHAERHPVADRVLRTSMASAALRSSDGRITILRDLIAELLSMEGPRKRFAAMLSGLDIRYDLGEGHPLLGRRMPDLDLMRSSGLSVRVFALLNDARPLLLNFGVPNSLDIAPWADRVRLIEVTYSGTWELPALGLIAAPTAVLIRPDGYVAWVQGPTPRQGLPEALSKWFGEPTATDRMRTD